MNGKEKGALDNGLLWVYILACGDGTLYTGMTTALEKRLRQHQQKTARCKFTRRADKHPIRLGAAWELSGLRGNALTLERYIKGLSRAQKLLLLSDKSLLVSLIEKEAGVLPCPIIPYQGDLYDLEECS